MTEYEELIGRVDALFDARSAESMAERLAAVLDDSGFADALRRHGLARAATYTWERSAALAWYASPWITPCGAEPVPSGTSSLRPVFGSNQPRCPLRWALNHTPPSGAGARS